MSLPTSKHPIDVLLDALRDGPADMVTLTQRTGFYAGAIHSLIVRARASGFDITAMNHDGLTIFELKETSDDERA